VLREIEPERAQRSEVQVENVRRRGLQNDLVLVVMLEAVRVLAVAAVLRAARWLHVRRAPRLGSERAQERRGVRRAGADFDVVRLQQRAAAIAPVALKRLDDLLECRHAVGSGSTRFYLRRSNASAASTSAAQRARTPMSPTRRYGVSPSRPAIVTSST